MIAVFAALALTAPLMPDAHLEVAVNRAIGGCPAPIIVRFNVSR